MFRKAWERLVQINRETGGVFVVGLVAGLLAGLLVGPVVGLAFGLAFGLVVRLISELFGELVAGLISGLVAFMGWAIGTGIAYLILTVGWMPVVISVAAVGIVVWYKHTVPCGNEG